MRVGIIQSNFLPWRGYFDFIREVDLFIVHDDLQYTKGDWRNRNKIKTRRGAEWITVPVHYQRTAQLIDETLIDYEKPWARKMLNRISESYRQAPYFTDFYPELEDGLTTPTLSISDLNVRLIQWICGRLGVRTPLRMSREYRAQGTKTERLIALLHQAGATSYLSGPAAQAYLDPEMFERAGVRLEFKTYDYAEYPQLYPPFDPAVSVIDLLFMTGPDAQNFLEPPGARH